MDGEVESFELWPLARVLEAMADGDEFKFNVNLVLIDLFLRRGLVRSPELRQRLTGARPQTSNATPWASGSARP